MTAGLRYPMARLAIALLASAGSAGALGGNVPAGDRMIMSDTGARAQDPQLAVEAEFNAARLAGTQEAWDLFLQRHGDNKLAAQARLERARLGQPR